MLISIVNRSRVLPDADVQRAVRAVNRQLAEDFEPHWQFGARLRLDGVDERPHAHVGRVGANRLPGRGGDAVIYLMDHAPADDAEGWHDRNDGDVPFGFVFLDICQAAGDLWTVALSHEVIELVGDPMNNLLVQGPHPHDHRRTVFHTFELCDAVQAESYELEGVAVSNFLLPGWFASAPAAGARNDFLGRPRRGEVLPAFGIAPGGYLCFYDAQRELGERWTSVTRDGDDTAAAQRLAAKRQAKLVRLARRSRGC